MRPAPDRRPRGDDGFTLVELLVGMTVLSIVMLATFGVLDASNKVARSDLERNVAVRDVQVGFDRMIRELRQTRSVQSAQTQVITVTTNRRSGSDLQVTFDCSVAHPTQAGLRRCVRTADGASEVLVDRVGPADGSSTVFAYSPSAAAPRFVRVSLGAALDAGRSGSPYTPLELTDGTGLRNVP